MFRKKCFILKKMKILEHRAVSHVVPVKHGHRIFKIPAVCLFRINTSGKRISSAAVVPQIISVIFFSLQHRIINLRIRYPNPSINIRIDARKLCKIDAFRPVIPGFGLTFHSLCCLIFFFSLLPVFCPHCERFRRIPQSFIRLFCHQIAAEPHACIRGRHNRDHKCQIKQHTPESMRPFLIPHSKTPAFARYVRN